MVTWRGFGLAVVRIRWKGVELLGARVVDAWFGAG